MALILDNFIFEIILGLATLLFAIKLYFSYAYTYWAKRNVPHLTPKFPLGNAYTYFPKGISLGTPSKDYYDELKSRGLKFGGLYAVTQPQLLVVDPDYARDILTADFQYFVNRGVYHNEAADPISANLFTQDGAEWRGLRVKFTPIFTSGKMKVMFNTVVKSTEGLIDILGHKKTEIDIHEAAGCFTTDVIGSVVYGIECNSFKDPDAEFRKMGRKIFTVGFWQSISLFLSINMPRLAHKLGVRNFTNEEITFFQRIVREAVQYRDKNKIVRPDFLQMLIDIRNKAPKGQEFTLNEMAAQTFLFFAAGFETSSSTMTYALFELAQNPPLQERLRKEITEVLKNHNGEVTYEAIKEMKYLGQVVEETLRKYPPVSTLSRVASKPYTLRNTNTTIEQDTTVLVSVLGLHRDPDYWPEPTKWDPDRFSDENKKGRHPYVYIPFGEGPRNCIGLRFGLMQSKIGIVTILKNFKIKMNPKTITPIKFNPDTFVLFPINKIYLDVEKISSH